MYGEIDMVVKNCLLVWLAQLVKSLAASACSLTRQVTGSIPGADNLDSGFHPFGVGKMSSSKYVVG